MHENVCLVIFLSNIISYDLCVPEQCTAMSMGNEGEDLGAVLSRFSPLVRYAAILLVASCLKLLLIVILLFKLCALDGCCFL